MLRLNKYLAQCGLGSRRTNDLLIQKGKISVNDKIVTQLGMIIDESKDQIKFDGILLNAQEPKIYVLLNKPTGYVTTVKDQNSRKTVLDLIDVKQRIFPVGRLDKNTEGLLLLTNDGPLCYHLTHPKFFVEKEYRLTIDRKISEKDIKKIESGIMIETGLTAPCKIIPNKQDKSHRTLNIILHEGKKRQIRRMFETLGYSIARLIRIRFANLNLNDLNSGKWRFLSQNEIQYLKNL